MGHTAYHYNHRKNSHPNEIDQDKENGVTKPKWWLPTEVTKILDRKAIQQKMISHHKEDWAQVKTLTNRDKTEDHADPSTPTTFHIDEEPPMADCTIHPDLETWRKVQQQKKDPQTT
ncbi:hypothetical protein DSO57_1009478 [Entomophthora muscae]|uniref:Uncharacterized protein n=1 Tax=Entomophthora muscae TaxID=34485 RepID=A0ACC2UFS6_9FUNG|nr:hypothetical protein DSO57_1009478 [Entomophthora muscae]